jgi:hypothetical protein
MMRPRSFVSPTLALTTVLLIANFAPANDQPPRIRAGDLDGKALTAGPFKITINGLKGGFFKIGDYIEVRVENTSPDFATFSPQHLSLVNSNGDQVDLLTLLYVNQLLAPQDRRIAPGARIKEKYGLSGRVSLPARLFYDDELLVIITD